MTYVDEDLDDLLRTPLPPRRSCRAACRRRSSAPGRRVRYSAMPEMFETLMFAARRELVITTPYYVPDESLQNALCTTARRGVDTTIIFPARNDSWIVGAASRSYYADLLAAGVEHLRIRGRPAAHQVADAGRRDHADRLGQHGPPQLRSELREQHPVP